MKLDYVLYDPTGNITILVETPVPAASQPVYAAKLLAAEPTAEQVGFLAPGGAGYEMALRMAGGEFCGNATMSAAAYECARRGYAGRVRVRVSGAAEPVETEITGEDDGGWIGSVQMPVPTGPENRVLTLDGKVFQLPLMRYDGISHLIVTEPMERGFAERAVRRWCDTLGVDGLGLMLLDDASNTLTPLVYIPGSDTLYWEHSCASGTAALGTFFAETKKTPISQYVAEPGGILKVSAAPGGGLTICGRVKALRRGNLDTND